MSDQSRENDMFPNKFAGTCNNPTCKTKVGVREGFAQNINNRWALWCKKCIPVRIDAPIRRILTSDGKILTPYEPHNLDLIRSIPGARWDLENKWWNVSLEMSNRRRLLEVADKIGIEVPPSLRIVEVSEEAQNATDAGLYPFQVEGVNFLAHKQKVLLGDDMGLGKTVQSLMGIPSNGNALVICRAGLKYNWLDEVNKWRPDLKPVVLSGRKNFRWPKAGEVVIINSDVLPKEFDTPKKKTGEVMEDYWDRLKRYRQDLKDNNPESANVTLIVDEAHDFKNKEAARTRKVKEFGRLAHKLIGLTGSPLTNRPVDLFGVLNTLGLDKEVFGTWETWERFQLLFDAHKESVWTGSKYIEKIVWGKPQPIVPELLRRVMLRRLRKDVLPDLPPKTYTNLLVGMTDTVLEKELTEMWEEWGTAIQIEGILPPFEKFSKIRERLARSRIKDMLEYVENAEEQDVPLVVFSAHLSPIDALLGRPGWAVITGSTSLEKRQEIVNAFQNGQLKGVALTIKAGGVGINLTHAWKALFVDLEWQPAAIWQAEDRIVRIGQLSSKIEIVRMVSDHPLDLHIHNLLVDKIDTITKAIDSEVEGEKFKLSNTEGETEEQFQERMAKLLEQAENHKKQEENDRKTAIMSKVDIIHSREKSRLKKVLPLTPARINAVRESFKYMLSVCDGAQALDNVGFNKPDASVAHWLLSVGLEGEREVEAAFFMLSRYNRQLASKYPVLFK